MTIIQHQIAKTRDDLVWLAAHNALRGVAEIIAERRAQVERGDEPPTAYAAEMALDSGEYAKAAALIAAELDQEAGDGP